MTSLSIKKKMMIWYAFVLIVIVILASAVLLITGNKLVRDNAKANLTVATDRALSNVRIISGKLNIDDDIEYYSNEVYIVIYKEDGMQLSGLEMDGFEEKVAFEADTIREVGNDDSPVYVYDRLIENKKTGKIWVRGMTSADLEEISPGISKILKVFLITVPLLLVLALLGGWMITRRAFAPLKEINETAQKIYEGNDLSLRINADGIAPGSDDAHDMVAADGSGGDEIMQTAHLFNKMLDGIERNFESEKRFTNDASHELRTPTAVIRAQSEYALTCIDDPAEVEEALGVILKQSEKMSDLLDKLLMLARADRGVIVPEKELVDLGLLVESASAHLAGEAEKKNITIDVRAEEVTMMGDVSLLERAVENLISNAIKYGKNGGHVAVSLETENAQGTAHGTSGGNDERMAVIKVADDGIGIQKEHIDHIWERFYRAQGAGDHESMGLGLSLTKWIVSEHDGHISVQSSPGEGSTFTIVLPVA